MGRGGNVNGENASVNDGCGDGECSQTAKQHDV